MDRTILLIDDDVEILRALSRFVSKCGWIPLTAADSEEGLRLYLGERPDLVLLDLQLPGMGGMEVLAELRRVDPMAMVIILTGHGDVPTAVEAMRGGAENFLTKPVEFSHLEAVLTRGLEKADLLRHNHRLMRELADSGDGLRALGSSPKMREIAKQVSLLASSPDTTVLLLGESGTGKGWLSRVIHDLSRRAARSFMEINCAGLSGSFLRSELFGHERGAFTDAKERRRGLFEIAEGGTVLLDEIGDLSLEIQPKLLNVLEDRRFRRLGGTREIAVNVRVIAATNQDLKTKVERGEFRQDLYYRLNVMPLTLPPLRERAPEDVLDLVGRLFVDLCQHLGSREAQLSEALLQRLIDYSWPGNVRELRNVLERALILAGGPSAAVVLPEHLPSELNGGGASRIPTLAPSTLEAAEARHVTETLAYHGGNRTRAAAALGITRSTLLRKIAKYGLKNVGDHTADSLGV